MDISVSDEAIKATTRCRKGFSCLKIGFKGLCSIEDCVNKQIPFIKHLNDECCPYQQAFGNEFLCICPVRNEIFIKYKI
jgi:hypothetical protein